MALALPPAEPTLGAGESAMRQIDTVSQSRPITGRLAYGAIAGICGTLAMTSAMRLLARELAPGERYPLPPREIVERMAPRSAATVLAPANRHPGRRNALMVAAHVVWGVVLAGGLREIERAEREVFAAGDIRDRPRPTD
jgi:hypothetical protein